jgi:drug/metabolite transporter (DMT)-like permease
MRAATRVAQPARFKTSRLFSRGCRRVCFAKSPRPGGGASVFCACCRSRSFCGCDGRSAATGSRWRPWAFAFSDCFFVLYNIAISYTTAARASLALSTLPLQTMIVGALLGIEPLTRRKTTGVCIAVLGVFAALASGLSDAPLGAWRGELIMTGAVLCMAFYNV